MMKSTVCLVVLASLAACGSEQVPDAPDASAAACPTPAAERLLPLAIGNTWTYLVTSSDGATSAPKTSTIEAREDVGDRKAGVVAFRARTEKLDGITVSWQEDQCTEIARHREQSFDLTNTLLSDQFYVPEKVRLDETAAHTALAASWATAYVEVEIDPVTTAVTTKDKNDRWTVEAVDEAVTVPAGTFAAIKIHRVGDEEGQADKTYWFARGIGKIKETGKQTEELVSYDLAAPP